MSSAEHRRLTARPQQAASRTRPSAARASQPSRRLPRRRAVPPLARARPGLPAVRGRCKRNSGGATTGRPVSTGPACAHPSCWALPEDQRERVLGDVAVMEPRWLAARNRRISEDWSGPAAMTSDIRIKIGLDGVPQVQAGAQQAAQSLQRVGDAGRPHLAPGAAADAQLRRRGARAGWR